MYVRKELCFVIVVVLYAFTVVVVVVIVAEQSKALKGQRRPLSTKNVKHVMCAFVVLVFGIDVLIVVLIVANGGFQAKKRPQELITPCRTLLGH